MPLCLPVRRWGENHVAQPAHITSCDTTGGAAAQCSASGEQQQPRRRAERKVTRKQGYVWGICVMGHMCVGTVCCMFSVHVHTVYKTYTHTHTTTHTGCFSQQLHPPPPQPQPTCQPQHPLVPPALPLLHPLHIQPVVCIAAHPKHPPLMQEVCGVVVCLMLLCRSSPFSSLLTTHTLPTDLHPLHTPIHTYAYSHTQMYCGDIMQHQHHPFDHHLSLPLGKHPPHPNLCLPQLHRGGFPPNLSP